MTTTTAHDITLAVEGMRCACCVGRVGKVLRQVPGVLAASVNLASETATVTVQDAGSDTAPLAAALQRNGYTLRVPETGAATQQPVRLGEGARVALAAVLSAPLGLPMGGLACWRAPDAAGDVAVAAGRAGAILAGCAL